jgi:hypothetical protein
MATFPLKQAISGSGSTGRVVIVQTDSSNTYVVQGNSSVSNLAVGTENVASATITKVFWAGNTQIQRNSVLIFNAPQGTSGDFDFARHDIVLNQEPTSNLVVTTTGMAILEVRKKLV